jgi:hypothetical protein
MANPLLYGKVIKAGANALDYKLSPLQEKLLDPVGAAKDYLVGKAEEAMGVPKDTIGAVTDPKGFVGGVLKDTAKDYFKEKGEIPEEDRSFSSSGGGNKLQELEAMEYEGDYKRGGKVKTKPVAKSKVSTASRRGDGIAQRGKTRGRMR